MDPDPKPVVFEHRSFARIGFLGNPSDVYFGLTISFTICNFWASVKLEPSDHLLIKPHPFHDFVRFNSLGNLVYRLQHEGYYGGTGLSGSSAIVSAALSCLLDFYNVRKFIRIEVRPNLILNAEKELGIIAGLQDRVAQVYGGGLVHMDFSKDHMEKVGYGIYTVMDINLLPPLHLIYAENPSDSGKVHSSVRKRWLDGDEFIISTMSEIAKLAEEGRIALLEKDYYKLKQLMNRNFDLRRSMFGDECLGEMNIEMVEVARKIGAAAKFTGSGGAVVVFCPEGTSQVKLLEEECRKSGFILEPVKLVPT
ncbi:unnamed protein product [Cochlearia groenlandica]